MVLNGHNGSLFSLPEQKNLKLLQFVRLDPSQSQAVHQQLPCLGSAKSLSIHPIHALETKSLYPRVSSLRLQSHFWECTFQKSSA